GPVGLAPLLAPLARIGRIGEPAVIEPSDPFEALAHHAPDPDRRPARTVRRRAERGLLHDPAAVPVDRLAGPQLARQAQPFEHAADALLERHATGGEFGADVRHVAGDADAEDEAALADL